MAFVPSRGIPASSPRSHPSPVNFDDYCQQKAAPDGSSTYYALRRAPAARQPLLTALYALRRELEVTVKKTSAAPMGRTKPACWQRKWGSLFGGDTTPAPAPPVTKALQAHAAN